MEKPPSPEPQPENAEVKKLSFEDQTALAVALRNANEKVNNFIERQGGFDTFAESGAHVPDIRAMYDAAEKAVAEARKKLDENVADKQEFVRKLKESGDDELADYIAPMFGVEVKKNLFSRIFKRKK